MLSQSANVRRCFRFLCWLSHQGTLTAVESEAYRTLTEAYCRINRDPFVSLDDLDLQASINIATDRQERHDNEKQTGKTVQRGSHSTAGQNARSD